MNKKLIKKYKTEFDHWLNGEDITVVLNNGGWLDTSSFNWSDYTNSEVKYIVINDEYVEFRKALAEGKTIEVYNNGYYKQLLLNEWVPMDSLRINTSIPVKDYRIKPEESKFKVGDWVVSDTNIVPIRITQIVDDKFFVDKNSCRMWVGGNCELWQPKEGEWCWFGVLLVKVESISENPTIYTLYTKTSDGQEHKMVETDCNLEPFIGELPSFIKD